MRFNFENYLNIYLPRTIQLHHIDCNRKNNQIENLILVRNNIHKKIHLAIKQGQYLHTRRELQRYLRELGEPRKLWLKLSKQLPTWNQLSKSKQEALKQGAKNLVKGQERKG